MSLNWKRMKTKIAVANTDSPVSAVGRGVGNWCVHKSQSDKNRWSITHAPTGLQLTQFTTQKECVRFVEFVSRGVFGFTYFGIDKLRAKQTEIESRMEQWVSDKSEAQGN